MTVTDVTLHLHYVINVNVFSYICLPFNQFSWKMNTLPQSMLVVLDKNFLNVNINFCLRKFVGTVAHFPHFLFKTPLLSRSSVAVHLLIMGGITNPKKKNMAAHHYTICCLFMSAQKKSSTFHSVNKWLWAGWCWGTEPSCPLPEGRSTLSTPAQCWQRANHLSADAGLDKPAL